MKKKNFLIGVLAVIVTVLVPSCTESNDELKSTSILPTSFNIDVPSSLANRNNLKSAGDTINGNDIYAMMRAFIAVGNGSGLIVKELMSMISFYNIDKPMDVTYVSEDDLRMKRLIVTANKIYEGDTYEYKMVIMDVEDPLLPKYGLEMYWNRAPITGVSIFNFYNLNQKEEGSKTAKYRIDYSEASLIYDKTMEVTIVGIDTTGTDENVDNLKMFVGKKGNLLDVYGNANLPDAEIIDTAHVNGYNWAFVARSNEALNIAVAQVALPPCTLNDLKDIFTTHSIKNVLTSEIHNMYPFLDSKFVANFLKETDSPAYFNGTQGFISCGATVPAGFTSDFINLSNLQPYYPYQIDDLALFFSDELR